MNQQSRVTSVTPFSLRDAPSFLERQFPVGRISAEVYKERKAIHGQLLTSLGSYWKGRKPLLLVRAVVLGVLLPATDSDMNDLRVFLKLLRMDEKSLGERLKPVQPAKIDAAWPEYEAFVDPLPRPRWRDGTTKETRREGIRSWAASLPYEKRIALCLRPDELIGPLDDEDWKEINAHLGTSAASLDQVVEQLGIMRFGRRPRIADTFSGSGSIPFEAARLGCDVEASDLNPIACMLTWGTFNVIGRSLHDDEVMRSAQLQVRDEVARRIDELGIERSQTGKKAKAYLYCVEAFCPKTGYYVPLAPSWVISRNNRTIARLVARPISKDYEIQIHGNATDDEIAGAEHGTLVDDAVVHPMNPDREGVALSVIRGERKNDVGENVNSLRLWSKDEIAPRADDRLRERLYCIQWIEDDTEAAAVEPEEVGDDSDEEEDGLIEDTGSRSTFFAAPTAFDLRNEAKVNEIVHKNLARWQEAGLIPSTPIIPGQKTNEPIRTRGWTHWHHLFTPRHLLFGALALGAVKNVNHPHARGALAISFCRSLNYMSRMTQWMVRKPTPRKPADVVNHVFYNQALNTFYNYGARASVGLLPAIVKDYPRKQIVGSFGIESRTASDTTSANDIYITDPPYADAVVYHEITEYFISWMEKLGRDIFPQFEWSSQRAAAIKGSDERFRSEMVNAYKAMTEKMPTNGMQVVMFTHQNVAVWSDLAGILWTAGLRVSGAWNVVTETSSATKKGNFVKGTIILVLRKRTGNANAKRMDIEGEIDDAVDAQIAAMQNLSDDWTAERLYTDGDMQLAAYAAALRVITNYETIDRAQVGADVYRKLKKGERTAIRDLIDYAASVASNKLIPEGCPAGLWRDLDKTSRFYVRMLDMEAKGTTKSADYSDFAKAFSVGDYTDLMANTAANKAALAGAATLKARMLGGTGFGIQPLRRVLFAIHKTMQKDDPKAGLDFLHSEYGGEYWTTRTKLIEFARYIAAKTSNTRPDESMAADLLAQKLEVDRV